MSKRCYWVGLLGVWRFQTVERKSGSSAKAGLADQFASQLRSIVSSDVAPEAKQAPFRLWLARLFGGRFGSVRLLLPEDEQGQEKEQNETYGSYGDRDGEEYGGYDGSDQDSAP